ncbi:MAG: hypothetical protein RL021_2054, partial [Bacteroidota bacterium]
MTPRRFTNTGRNQISVRYYLNQPKGRSESIILLSVNHPQFRLKLSTGERITPSEWNPNSQRPRRSHPNFNELTAYLDKLEHSVKAFQLSCKVEGREFTPEAIRSLMSDETKCNVPEPVQGFYEAYNEYLTLKRGKLSEGFLYKMGTLKKLIQDFESRHSYPVTFQSVNLNFHERFTSYLTNERGQLDSTSNKYIALLKAFMNWSLKLKKHTSVDFKDSDFKSTPVDSELIALTLEEVMSLFRLDLPAGSRL